MRKIVLFVILLMVVVGNNVWADNFDFASVTATGQTLYYKIMSRNTVAVTYPDDMQNPYDSHIAPVGNIAIPSTVRNGETSYSVVAIDEYAFYGCGRLTGVIIPNTVTIIGKRAFYGDMVLASVTIPGSVATIDRYAFGECSQLRTVVLPATLSTLGEGAFFSCIRLDSIALPAALQAVPEVCFYSCLRLSKVVLPATMARLDNYSFSGCVQLSSIVLPESVESVGEGTFYSCTRLDSIVIPASVASIGAYAFKDCPELSKVRMVASIPPSLGQEAFDAEVTIWVPCNSKSDYVAEASWSIYSHRMSELCAGASVNYDFSAIAPTGQLLYYSISEPNVVKLKAVGITDDDQRVCEISEMVSREGISYSVAAIDSRAFYHLDGITKVIIPCSIKSIADSSFAYCGVDSVIMLSATPPTVGSGVFMQDAVVLVPCERENNYYANVSWRSYASMVSGYCTPLPIWDFEAGDWGWTHDGYWAIDTGESNYGNIGLSESARKAYEGDYAFFCSNLRVNASQGNFAVNTSYLRSRGIQIDNHPNQTPITISFYAFSMGFMGPSNDVHYNTLVLEYATTAEGPWSELWSLPQEAGAEVWRQYDVAFSEIISEPGTYYFRFVNSGAGYCSGIDDFRITANPIVRHRLSVMVQRVAGETQPRGIVTGGGIYAEGSPATIEAGAFRGYRFAQWSDGSTEMQRTIEVNTDTVIFALFEVNSYDTTSYHYDTLYHDTLIREVVYDTFDVFDTLVIYDTLFSYDTIVGYDTIFYDSVVMQQVFDTVRTDTLVVETVYDTLTVYDTTVVYDFHDTTVVSIIYDTMSVFDTLTVYDTVVAYRDSVVVRTSYDIRDTVLVHTTFDTLRTYDTTYLYIDTVLRHNVYDTSYVYETVFVMRDSVVTSFDTVVIYQTIFDTMRIEPLHDTVVVVRLDTVLETVYDTVCPETDGVGAVIENNPVRISTEGRQIILDECYGATVAFYDMSGRLLDSRSNAFGSLSFTAPSTGVYLIRVSGAPAQKVVIRR